MEPEGCFCDLTTKEFYNTPRIKEHMEAPFEKQASDESDYVVYLKNHNGPYDRMSWTEWVYHKAGCSVLNRINPSNRSNIKPVKKGDKVQLINGKACKVCGVDKMDIHNWTKN
jgi:hypothetical protein